MAVEQHKLQKKLLHFQYVWEWGGIWVLQHKQKLLIMAS